MAQERLTWFGITYDLSDVTALGDSTPSTSNNQSFGNIDLLKNYDYSKRYMTLEHNFTLLDGVQPEINESVEDVAFFSDELADADGYFTDNPMVEVNFTIYHSSFALTLYFDEEHPLQIRIQWYRDDLKLVDKLYDITECVQVIPTDVELYNKIVIQFVKVLPYHYAKLYSIRYGMVIEWDEENLKKGTIVQELNRISDKLPINKLSFEVVDVNHGLNFGNVEGMHKYYQRNQAMMPYEMLNNTRIDFGKFYLDKFSSEKNLGKMSSVSILGRLDTVQYNKGGVYTSGINVKTLIDDIFAVGGVEEYYIDQETANQTVYGALSPMSCRNALKEVLFACNSIIDTTQDPIRIYKYKRSVSNEVPRSMKYSTKISRGTYISGVEIKYNSYTVAEEAEQISQEDYLAGTHTVVFTQPYSDITISGATLVDSSTYYVTFICEEDSTVTLTGKRYDSATHSIAVNRPYIDPGEVVNVKTYTSALCNAKMASALASELLEWFSKERLVFNIKQLSIDHDMNGGVDLENPEPRYRNFIAWYNKRSFDMTGGFIDTAELSGNYIEDELYYYTGTELYADNSVII